jgi:hypothetical protein
LWILVLIVTIKLICLKLRLVRNISRIGSLLTASKDLYHVSERVVASLNEDK